MPMPEMAFAANPLLTNVGLNRLANLNDYAGQNLLPSLASATPTGTYNEWTVGDFIRREGKEIANYEAVPLGGFTTAERTFSVKNWGVGTPYTARDLAAARSKGITDQAFKNAKARWVTTQGVMELEFRVRDLFQTTANWGATIGGVTSNPVLGTSFIQWDQAAATPVDDIAYYKRAVRLRGGREPNTLILPELVLMALRKNAQLIARATPRFYGGNAPMEVQDSDIAALFGVRIWTPKALYNSAKEGQTAVLAEIWGNTMWLGYLNPEWNDEEPTAAAIINWTGNTTNGLPPGMSAGEGPQMFGSVENEQGLFVRDYPDLPRGAIVIEGMLWRSPVIVAAEMGMTFTAPIA